jgi:hypothetical protein
MVLLCSVANDDRYRMVGQTQPDNFIRTDDGTYGHFSFACPNIGNFRQFINGTAVFFGLV